MRSGVGHGVTPLQGLPVEVGIVGEPVSRRGPRALFQDGDEAAVVVEPGDRRG